MAWHSDVRCLLGPVCALCRQRRMGKLLEPLTAAEWSRAFRNAKEGVPDDYGPRHAPGPRLPRLPL